MTKSKIQNTDFKNLLDIVKNIDVNYGKNEIFSVDDLNKVMEQLFMLSKSNDEEGHSFMKEQSKSEHARHLALVLLTKNWDKELESDYEKVIELLINVCRVLSNIVKHDDLCVLVLKEFRLINIMNHLINGYFFKNKGEALKIEEIKKARNCERFVKV